MSAELASLDSPPGSLQTKRILVVEDDPSITLGLTMNLQAEGYEVRVADDGEAGLAEARRGEVDLIILDLMLPKLNGFELMRRLRSEGHVVPTIVLSARDAELDIVMGLEFGAEDYVTKPFGLAELLARVKTVLRRTHGRRPEAPGEGAVQDPRSGESAAGEHATLVRAGGLVIDRRTRQVTRDGEPVSLTTTEFDILWCLVRGEGRVMARDEIQSEVWGPGHHGTLRTIDNFMMQLRTKLENDPAEPRHLLTVRGVGYRFAP